MSDFGVFEVMIGLSESRVRSEDRCKVAISLRVGGIREGKVEGGARSSPSKLAKTYRC